MFTRRNAFLSLFTLPFAAVASASPSKPEPAPLASEKDLLNIASAAKTAADAIAECNEQQRMAIRLRDELQDPLVFHVGGLGSGKTRMGWR